MNENTTTRQPRREFDSPEEAREAARAMAREMLGDDWENKIIDALKQAVSESITELHGSLSDVIEQATGQKISFPPPNADPLVHESYDAAGKVRVRVKMRPDGQLESIREFDSEGRLSKDTDYDEKSQMRVVREYKDGTLVKQTPFEDGLIHGEVIESHPDGRPKQLMTVDKGKTRTIVDYHDNGKIKDEKHFDDRQKLSGVRKQYFPNGNLYKEEAFEDNTLNGPSRLFAEDGTLVKEGAFLQGKPHGVLRQYYPNGQVEVERSFSEGVLQGPSRSYSPEGVLLSLKTFAAGELNGPFVTYHPNGKKKILASMKNGKLDGEFGTFDDQERPKMVAQYREGKLNGRATMLKKGSPMFVAEYKDGKKNGIYTAFYKGTPRVTGEYKDDKKHGKETAFYEDGKIARVCNYKDGERHGAMLSFGMKGELLQEQTFVNGMPQGTVTSFFPDGSPREKQEFKEGKPHGPKVEYQPKFKKKEQTLFREGEKVGKTVKYNRLGLPTIPSLFRIIQSRIDYTAQWTGFRLRDLWDWLMSFLRR